MTDEQVVNHLKQKEAMLINQLEKVRIALSIFDIGETYQNQLSVGDSFVYQSDNEEYDQYLSLDQKVIFALRKINNGYIDDIVNCLISQGDKQNRERLFKSLTGSASKLLGKGILTADKRGKKFKYHLNPEKEKERAEILPL